MKVTLRIAFAVLLQVFVLPLFGADAPKSCAFCFGIADPQTLPASPVPAIVYTTEDDFATTATRLDALSSEQRKQTTLVVAYKLAGGADALTEVEQHTKNVIDFARLHGPFDALAATMSGAD